MKTPGGHLGTVELAAGVHIEDVVRAMRAHRLFIVPDDAAPTSVKLDDPKPGAATVLAPGGAVKSGKAGKAPKP